VAEQIAHLLEGLGLERYDLVGHDWGAAITRHLAAHDAEGVRRVVRMQASVDEHDTSLTPWWGTLSDPATDCQAIGPRDLGTRRPGNSVARGGIARQCLRPNAFVAWCRYWQDTPPSRLLSDMPALVAQSGSPVLLLQSDSDPGQPLSEFDGVEDLYPDARMRVIEDAGHFLHRDRPESVNEAIADFLDP